MCRLEVEEPRRSAESPQPPSPRDPMTKDPACSSSSPSNIHLLQGGHVLRLSLGGCVECWRAVCRTSPQF
eukprot:2851954-Alexandrium_andersonii.AAC.1